MGYVKTVTTTVGGGNPWWLVDMMSQINGMSAVYEDNGHNVVFQYEDYDIFWRVNTTNGYDIHLFVEPTKDALTGYFEIYLTTAIPKQIQYVKVKNGIYIMGLGANMQNVLTIQDKGIIYISRAISPEDTYVLNSNGVITLKNSTVGNILDNSNQSRTVIMPLSWSVPETSHDIPLYSSTLSVCPNKSVQALPMKSIIQMNNILYFKLYGSSDTNSGILIPVDTEVSAA